MLIVRLAKILMIAPVGAFAFMVTYDNIVDYGSNYEFVRRSAAALRSARFLRQPQESQQEADGK